MTNLIGQSLGRYHILEQLGEGGMATVYKAFDTRLERDVAIKIIRREAFPPDQLDRILKRFEREAKALAKLSHPNIVGVIDYGDHEGSPYLVMEFLPSGTLKDRLGKSIPWQEAVRLLLPIARALQFAHQRGIIHRDIKPSNILITESGEPMLADFGIAKILESGDATTLTGAGVGVGTPEYMSPEQWVGKVIPQSDIYSLGMVMYEMITGCKPYIADTPAAILLKQATEPLPRPLQYVPNLPEVVEKVLLKALARKPEDRYLDMATFASDLYNLPAGQSEEERLFRAGISTPHPVKSLVDSESTISQSELASTQIEGASPNNCPPEPMATPDWRKAKTDTPKPKIKWRWALGFLIAAVCIPILSIAAEYISSKVIEDIGFTNGDPSATSEPVKPIGTQLADSRINLLVATDATWAPFEYIDENTKKIIGFDIDLMQAIADKENMEVEFVSVAWDTLLSGVANCQYDVAVSAISITEERKANMLFSDPYYTIGQQIVVAVDNTDITNKASLVGKRVGAQISTGGAELVSGIEGAELVDFNTVGLAFQALLNGDVEAVVADNVIAMGYVATYPELLKAVGKPLMGEFLAIAVCKTKTDLLNRINTGLVKVMDEGIIDILNDKWINRLDP